MLVSRYNHLRFQKLSECLMKLSSIGMTSSNCIQVLWQLAECTHRLAHRTLQCPVHGTQDRLVCTQRLLQTCDVK